MVLCVCACFVSTKAMARVTGAILGRIWQLSSRKGAYLLEAVPQRHLLARPTSGVAAAALPQMAAVRSCAAAGRGRALPASSQRARPWPCRDLCPCSRRTGPWQDLLESCVHFESRTCSHAGSDLFASSNLSDNKVC